MLKKLQTISIAVIILMFTITMIIFPEHSLKASLHGLHTWWEIVFPSLLPFFIVSELLISFGIVQFLGVLFEPLMRPLFNVPGSASFAWILGMVSGFPSGAKITAMLREKKELTQIEAERLVAFSNASSPLFIFGAIAVGFFQQVQYGIIIAFSHYISNFFVGICMRFYKQNREPYRKGSKKKSNLLKAAFIKMHNTRIKEKRPFGELIGDAVLSSVQTLLMIGGFIILFSVFTSLFTIFPFFKIIEKILSQTVPFLHFSVQWIQPLFIGMIEITLGTEAISQLIHSSLFTQLALISFILGFNGFSIQAQVAALLAKTDIRFHPYFCARILHAFMASIFTIVLMKFHLIKPIQTIETTKIYISSQSFFQFVYNILIQTGPILTIFSLFICSIYLMSRLKRSS